MLWGSTNRAQFSYFGSLTSTVKKTGAGLKSAREISNILFRSSKDVFDSRGLNELAVFFGQFINNNLLSAPASKKKFNILVPLDDPVFGNSTLFRGRGCNKVRKKNTLPFLRSCRVSIKRGNPAERPQNTVTSALDLSAVYGSNRRRHISLRTGFGGRMIVTRGGRAGDLLPVNTVSFNNAPKSNSKQFFLAGDHRANVHPMITSLHTIFARAQLSGSGARRQVSYVD